MINTLLSKLSKLDVHLLEVLKSASTALFIRVFGTLLGFSVSLLVARLLGAEGAGIYFLALSIATIAATIGRIGFDNTVIRFIASHAANNDWKAITQVYRTALKVISLTSILVATILFFSAEWLANVVFEKTFMELPFRLVSIAVVPLAFSLIHAECLRGLKKIPASEWLKTVSVSLLTLLLLYPMYHGWGVNGVIAGYVCAVFLTAILAMFFWFKIGLKDAELPQSNKGSAPLKPLLQSSWPLLGVAMSGLVMQQTPTVFLGVWGSPADVGVFNIANRLSSLLLFPLMAMITILAPKFAAMYAKKDMLALKTLANNSSRVLTYFAIPVALIIGLNVEWILSLFGAEFTRGAPVLMILLVGVIINAVTGPVANLLMMSGNEVVVRNTAILSSITTLILCFLLIPRYGLIGGAISTSMGIAIQNISLTFLVQRYLGFFPIPRFWGRNEK